MPESLPCAFYRAHGKEKICRVSTRKHTANNKHTATMLFAVCQPAGTWRTWITWLARGFCRQGPHGRHCLPCARVRHTANSNFRRVLSVRHTANFLLPSRPQTTPDGHQYLSCVQSDTRQMCPFAVCLNLGTQQTMVFVVCLRPAHGKHKEKFYIFSSKFFLHSLYIVWYSMFEYDI